MTEEKKVAMAERESTPQVIPFKTWKLFLKTVAAVGILLSYVNIGIITLDRFVPPNWDSILRGKAVIAGVMPIIVYSKVRDNSNLYGIGAIVELRNGGRSSIINGLEIFGEIDLTYNEYLAIFNEFNDGTTFDDSKWKDKQPFIRIKWNGAVFNETGTVRLEPRETAFVKFSFGKPRSILPIFPDHMATSTGCRDGSKDPTSWYPEVSPELLFTDTLPSRLPTKLRDAVTSGLLKFRVLVDGQVVESALETLNVGRPIEEKVWEETPGYVLYNTDQPGPYTTILDLTRP